MATTYNITNVHKKLPQLIKDLNKNGSILTITVYNEIAAYIVSAARMEAIAETMELLSNPDFMKIVSHHKAGTLKFFDLDVLNEEN